VFCTECGAENKSTAKFCEQCGFTLAVKTPDLTGGKPLGIVVIVILSVLSALAEMALGSILAIIPDLMGFVTTGFITIGAGESLDASVHIASLKIAGIAASLVGSGILTMAAAYGLWNFVVWGRILAVILYGVGLFVGFILFFIKSLSAPQTAGAITLQLIGFAVSIWILIYLFRPHIRDLFHGAPNAGFSLVPGVGLSEQNPASR
jgi:hypothetical protein